jgi:hypothetical protein
MITLTTPNDEKLFFKGTAVEIASVLLRLEFTAPADGKTIQVALYPYESQEAFDNGDSILSIEGVEGFTIQAKAYALSNEDDPETWKPQTITVAHDEVKAYLDGLGYLATISGI